MMLIKMHVFGAVMQDITYVPGPNLTWSCDRAHSMARFQPRPVGGLSSQHQILSQQRQQS